MESGTYPRDNQKEQGVHPPLPAPVHTPVIESDQPKQSRTGMIIGAVIAVVVLLGAFIGGIIYLAQPGTATGRIRDIFIIFMALEFLVIGLALIILIVQLATLINLLQNEVKPILESTKETASTLRGTAVFLSENLTAPVIKMNEYIAAMRRMVEMVGLF